MSQMYVVECLLDKEPRARKHRVARWIVSARSESIMTLRRQISSLAMMSAITMIGINTPVYSDELFNPHDGPPYDPPKPPSPPPLTPEQVKAQAKRARKAAKWAREAEWQTKQPIMPRAVAKLSNFGYPTGLLPPQKYRGSIDITSSLETVETAYNTRAGADRAT